MGFYFLNTYPKVYFRSTKIKFENGKMFFFADNLKRYVDSDECVSAL